MKNTLKRSWALFIVNLLLVFAFIAGAIAIGY